jgi:hypothetical protein
MIQPVLVSTLMLSAAIALMSPPVKALCIDEDNFSIERDDEASFVSSSPATSETEFRFEVDLGNLTSPEGSNEAEAMTSEERPTATEPPDNREPMDDTTATSPAVADFDSAGTSDAATLGVLEANAGAPILSREEYLNQMADDLNNCL